MIALDSLPSPSAKGSKHCFKHVARGYVLAQHKKDCVLVYRRENTLKDNAGLLLAAKCLPQNYKQALFG